MNDAESAEHVNRLAHATSPYLRAHADQPVDWHPWGAEAFAEAKRRDAPLMVSIGYSTCHWCHVMARESFSDTGVAAQINKYFVAVKVDREELPAVDEQYMNALQAMRGHGGWPLTAFADADGVPFFLGTYFPPEPRMGQPSFSMVLQAVANTWRERRAQVADITAKMRSTLEQLAAGPESAQTPAQAAQTGAPAQAGPSSQTSPADPAAQSEQRPLDRPFESAVSSDILNAQHWALMDEADTTNGGFGSAQKFPPLMSLMALIKGHHRGPERLGFIRRTFLSMASRGLRDHVAGGIFRYCVDPHWSVPHFEKMLYDNALYLRASAAWFGLEESLAPGSRWARLARREAYDTAEFLLRDMRLDSGGFATALDADSLDAHGQPAEGAFYLENHEVELTGSPYEPVLSQGLGLVLHAPGIEQWAENDEAGQNSDDNQPEPWLTQTALAARADLLRAREHRAVPLRDDKLITAHTAMTASAFAFASCVFDEPEWFTAAEQAFAAAAALRTQTGLARSAFHGEPGPGAAGLVDWAQLADCAVALGRVSTARELLTELSKRFLDGTVRDYEHDPLLAAGGMSAFDDTEPSGVAAAAHAALCLGLLDETADGTQWLQTAERLVLAASDVMYRAPRAAGWLQVTAEGLLNPVRVESANPRLLSIGACHPVTTVLSRQAPGSAVGQPQAEAATVCLGHECSLPTADPGQVRRLLDGASS
ncbi:MULTISPECIES: thioredoxin domain-containing protein [unclassified Brevibacterium]|uniref:thioredoxin domain-containing protein n=1 Tax=unclassified Brevibacterium TaxID=2614124 RepID=UPI0008A3FD51|nr:MULTISPECIES: DUF255 domain-containing protein [unclassified Brevibacterium]OFL67828.1 hypothetical protein HMPREF2757_09120 [Brevibacterium sp. HMSC063G07]OFS27506.1 hypothetical protein HMPREF3162_01870 [Brevibacterium sp. HMSC07C04]